MNFKDEVATTIGDRHQRRLNQAKPEKLEAGLS